MNKINVSSFLTGLLFGFGLVVSGMTNPGKVMGFLDLAGAWDPSLALVMAGAIAVGAIGFSLAKKRPQTLSGTPMSLPNKTSLDSRLIVGSLMFGCGWGLAGICPGPAVAMLGSGQYKVLLFIAAMLVGMLAFYFFDKKIAQK